MIRDSTPDVLRRDCPSRPQKYADTQPENLAAAEGVAQRISNALQVAVQSSGEELPNLGSRCHMQSIAS